MAGTRFCFWFTLWYPAFSQVATLKKFRLNSPLFFPEYQKHPSFQKVQIKGAFEAKYLFRDLAVHENRLLLGQGSTQAWSTYTVIGLRSEDAEKVIFFYSREMHSMEKSGKMVLCFKNFFDLLWEKIVMEKNVRAQFLQRQKDMRDSPEFLYYLG